LPGSSLGSALASRGDHVTFRLSASTVARTR
jgi:hypothetical protein